MNNLIVLYPVFFFLVFLFIKRKKNNMLYCGIILIYVFAGIASVYLVNNVDAYKDKQVDLFAILYHLVLLFLLLRPIKLYENKKTERLSQPNRIVMSFAVFLIFLFAIYIYNGIQQVSLLSILNDVQDLRQGLVEGDFDTSKGLMRYIEYAGKAFTVAPLALMFYYVAKEPQRKILIIVLFLCSLGTAVVELRVAAREYLVKYLFVAVALWYITKDMFTPQWKRIIKVGGVGVAIIVSTLFILISSLRFGDSNNTSTVQSMTAYLGQGFVNFSECFYEFPNGAFPEMGSLGFSVFAGKIRSVYNLSDQVSTNLELNSFYTAIGTWIIDCGVYLTVIITIIYALLFRIIGQIKTFNAFTLIYMAWVFEFVFSLLFFFNNPVTGMGLLCYALTIILDYLSSSCHTHTQ